MNAVVDHSMQSQPPEQRNASPSDERLERQYPQLYGPPTATSTPPAPEGIVADLVHHTNGSYMQPQPQPQQSYCAPNSGPHDCGSQDCGSYDHRFQDHRFQDHRFQDPRSYHNRSYDDRSNQAPMRPGCCPYGSGTLVSHERYSNAWPGEYSHQHPPTTMPQYQLPASRHASQALRPAAESSSWSGVGPATQQRWYESQHQSLLANSVRYPQPYDRSPPGLCIQQQAQQQLQHQPMQCGSYCSGVLGEPAVLVVMQLQPGGLRPISTSHVQQPRLEAPPPATAETVASNWS